MKKYLKHMKKDWYCFILGPLFMTLEACGEFILPFMNANIIDKGAATGDIAFILKKLKAKGWLNLIITATILLFYCYVCGFSPSGSFWLSSEILGIENQPSTL